MNPYADFLLVNEKKKKKKVDDVDFKIPRHKDYTCILKHNYRVKHLKAICKHYALKQGGNKPDLLKRLFNFLYLSSKLIPFQALSRGYLVKKFCNYSGPACLKRNICVNDTDFLITFSYGRALQQSALKAFAKEMDNIKNIQNVFNHRAKMNGLSSKGEWSKDLEKESAA